MLYIAYGNSKKKMPRTGEGDDSSSTHSVITTCLVFQFAPTIFQDSGVRHNALQPLTLYFQPTGSFSTYPSANECGFDRNHIIMDKNWGKR